jgi:hypothetical protein
MTATNDSARVGDRSDAAAGHNSEAGDSARTAGIYTAVYRDPDGNVVWTDTAPNLWTTVGKNFALDTVLAGSAYTAAWYLGLITSASYSAVAAGDTMASHAGWLEAGATNAPAYSESTRRAASWNSASAGSKALSAGVVFTFTASGTIKGPFLASNSTKDGTTGTLFSAGLFTGGDQAVSNGGTLTVSYSASLT